MKRTPAGEAARAWLDAERPFTRPQDALDEAMTHDDANVIALYRYDIEQAKDWHDLKCIALLLRHKSSLIRAALRDPWRRRRDAITQGVIR